MIWLFILLFIIAIVSVVEAISVKEWDGFFCGWICLGSVTLATIAGLCLWYPKQPAAMDVYRGKTTLEVTYRDSVAIDSVVVFKNEYKEK